MEGSWIMTGWIIKFLILGAAVGLVMLLHGVRPRWRTAGLMVFLALAGMVAGFLVVVVKFQPVKQAIFPFRYEAGDTWMGQQFWTPHDAPKWLTSLAGYGQIPPQEFPDEMLRSLPPDTGEISGVVKGPSYLPGVAYYDPNFVCGVPGAEPRDPSTVPGIITYRGARALLFYAFRSDQNVLIRGAFLVVSYGVGSALFFLCLRRLHPSARIRDSLARVDRARVLVRAAWWSIAWPAAVVLVHAFFFDLHRAKYYLDGAVLTLPLALGRAGVGAVWLGAILGSMLTFYAVAVRAAAKQAASGSMEALCDACGYPVADPHDQCPECGTFRDTGTMSCSRRLHLRTLVMVGLWMLVVFLLCAPMTLPLVGGLLPSSVVNAIGHSWYQLPGTVPKDLLAGF